MQLEVSSNYQLQGLTVYNRAVNVARTVADLKFQWDRSLLIYIEVVQSMVIYMTRWTDVRHVG